MRAAGRCFSLGGFLGCFGAVLLVSFVGLAGFFVVQFVRFLGLVAVWVCGVCMRSAFRLFFGFVGCGALAVFLAAFPNQSFKRDA